MYFFLFWQLFFFLQFWVFVAHTRHNVCVFETPVVNNIEPPELQSFQSSVGSVNDSDLANQYCKNSFYSKFYTLIKRVICVLVLDLVKDHDGLKNNDAGTPVNNTPRVEILDVTIQVFSIFFPRFFLRTKRNFCST